MTETRPERRDGRAEQGKGRKSKNLQTPTRRVNTVSKASLIKAPTFTYILSLHHILRVSSLRETFQCNSIKPKGTFRLALPLQVWGGGGFQLRGAPSKKSLHFGSTFAQKRVPKMRLFFGTSFEVLFGAPLGPLVEHSGADGCQKRFKKRCKMGFFFATSKIAKRFTVVQNRMFEGLPKSKLFGVLFGNPLCSHLVSGFGPLLGRLVWPWVPKMSHVCNMCTHANTHETHQGHGCPKGSKVVPKVTKHGPQSDQKWFQKWSRKMFQVGGQNVPSWGVFL